MLLIRKETTEYSHRDFAPEGVWAEEGVPKCKQSGLSEGKKIATITLDAWPEAPPDHRLATLTLYG
jgi:hypothetical protein